ncbi:MAG TPA: hypothetical protein VIJ21_06325, partial [Solirubrobacterales bacterium]
MKLWIGMIAVLCLGVVAGCGGGGSSSSSSTAPAEASGPKPAGEAAKPTVEAPPTSPPTKIAVTQPLSKRPPTGKTVDFLQCEFPACTTELPGMEAAIAALDWKLQDVVLGPTEFASGLEQAISRKPDYIAVSGVTSAAEVKPQLAEAAAAGIPVIGVGLTDKPAPGEFSQ